MSNDTPTTEHAYWVAECKGCGKRLIPKGGYLGPVDPDAVSAPVIPDLWPDVRCPRCGGVHPYKVDDFDVRFLPYLLPPEDFSDS